eukprot:11849606-Alexandrium_andersonii.AAC.1
MCIRDRPWGCQPARRPQLVPPAPHAPGDGIGAESTSGPKVRAQTGPGCVSKPSRGRGALAPALQRA